jgi:predicted PurR-regulated permease PerM
MVRLAAFGVFLVVLHFGRPIVIPVLLATLIAISLSKVLDLAEKRFPHWVAVSFAVLLAVAVVMALGFLTTRAATDFALAFGQYRGDFERLQLEAAGWLWDQGLGIPATAVEKFDPNEIVRSLAVPGLTLAAGVVSSGALVLLITVFLVVESGSISQKLQGIDRFGRMDVQVLRRAASHVQRYLLIKTVTSGVTGLLVAGLTSVVGLGHSLLFGLLAFVLNYIPSIGSILASIPAIALALVTLGWLPALGLALGYFVINLVIGILIEPRWAGQATDLSPSVVVLSMIFWGFVLGPIGALLSVPLTIIVRIIASQSNEWAWLSVLLSSPRSVARASETVSPPAQSNERLG